MGGVRKSADDEVNRGGEQGEAAYARRGQQPAPTGRAGQSHPALSETVRLLHSSTPCSSRRTEAREHNAATRSGFDI